MRHTLDAAYPTTRSRKGRTITTKEDPAARRRNATRVIGQLTFALAYHDMPRFPA